MAEEFLHKNALLQEQKLVEEKKIQERQQSADLVNQQMQTSVMADAPNALETSTLMTRKDDFAEVARAHRQDVTTGIDEVMAASEFKLESATSKNRTDVLKRQSGLNGAERAEYIKEYKDFYKSLGNN